MHDELKLFYRKNGKSLFALFCSMWIMIVLSVLSIAFTLFQECFPCSFDCTSNGIAYFLSKFYPFEHLLSGTILLMTIYVALASYVHGKKTESIKALQDLRKMLMTTENIRIHDLLEYDDDNETDKQKKISEFQKEFADRQGCVFNYIGILELSKFYIDEGIINQEQFKDQFGYRIKNIYANPLICKWLNKYPCYWKTLNALKKIIDE